MTNLAKQTKDTSTQTEDHPKTDYIPTQSHFNLSHLADLICVFFDAVPNFNSIHRRILSVIIYLLLRLFNLSLSKNITLGKIREILSCHPAFEERDTYLERLARQYDVTKIIWCPKYHCELNPIDTKRFVRSNNEQDFDKLFPLIEEAFSLYEQKKLNIKL